jgi:mRNA interferase YafQ
MLKVASSNQFKKDLKLAYKRGLKIDRLRTVVNALSAKETLPPQYRDHELIGRYKGFRECHIEPDWLLIYRIEDEALKLFLLRTGSHSDLF